MPHSTRNPEELPAGYDHRFIKSEAIILRLHDYSETSYVVSLLTRENGQMNALAKGGRRPKTIFEGELDLLADGEAVVLVRSQGLHLLTEFACRDMHAGLRNSTGRVSAAWYVAGVAGDVSPEGHPQPEIFDLLRHTLHSLESGDLAAAVVSFQVHLLKHSGTMPDLSSCAACGKPVPGDTVHYCFAKSGPLCDTCRETAGRTYEVSRAAITLIAAIGRSSPTTRRRTHIAPVLARETITFLGYIIASAFDQDSSALKALLSAI